MSLNENIRCTCIIYPANRQVGLTKWLLLKLCSNCSWSKISFYNVISVYFFEKFNKLFSLKCNPDDKLHPVETVTSPYLIFKVRFLIITSFEFISIIPKKGNLKTYNLLYYISKKRYYLWLLNWTMKILSKKHRQA